MGRCVERGLVERELGEMGEWIESSVLELKLHQPSPTHTSLFSSGDIRKEHAETVQQSKQKKQRLWSRV